VKAKSTEILESIYHRGQEKIWDGREVLKMLLEKHDGICDMSPRQSEALQNIFSVILEGEHAAWKVSLQLADKLENIEAKLAATSQAHDESRHFYVMRDYLNLAGIRPVTVPVPVRQALDMVISTDSLPKKLLGMQLMVEPVALTIFQEVRRVSPEPVLAELLEYFERDEARHVALGVHHLPVADREMGPLQIISLVLWQLRIFMLELQGLRELSDDFSALGLNAEDVFDLAERKQLSALQDFVIELGLSPKVWDPIRHLIRYQKRWMLK